jgi:transposase-like protein
VFAPGASVSVVARRYDVNANQVLSWRMRYRDVPAAAAVKAAARLVPVMVTPERDAAARQQPSVGMRISYAGIPSVSSNAFVRR